MMQSSKMSRLLTRVIFLFGHKFEKSIIDALILLDNFTFVNGNHVLFFGLSSP